MRWLKSLEFVIPQDHTVIFNIALQRAKIDLSNISSLTLGPHCEFMGAACPNIETLSSNTQHWRRRKTAQIELNGIYGSSREHFFPMISAASKFPNLSHLVLDDWWTTNVIEAIVVTMRNLQSLSLRGCQYKEGLAKLLPLLSHLKQLRFLSLPEPQFLETAFELPEIGSIRCPNRAGMRKYFEVERGKAMAKVALAVYPVCKGNIETLWIGDTRALEVVRAKNGETLQTKWHLDATKKSDPTSSNLSSHILLLDGS